MYVYQSVVTEVHDADTIHVVPDLGFGVKLHGTEQTIDGIVIRFAGCNGAELGTPGGDAAAANLKTLLPPGTPVVLRTVSQDKYGRWDADVIEVDGTDLIAQLITDQWLAPWNGVGERPVPPWPREVTQQGGTT